ncbi:hypothetical protein IFM89_035484 [Coptis chinensis]|uniref:Bifunctional inhibitor/plant lipid transfer protein/seed storage helical domain-containing protein n=1 Tax=Coptis chinensis TaxID=261450 RepID=A0A835H798_9MAGN|nr:hypothetical protein IFM89_035484 [Coptis chinensis]
MEVVKFSVIMVIIVGLTITFSNNQVLAQQCESDIQGLARECAQFVQRSGKLTRPSPGCCNILKNVDISYACKHVTRDVEQIISMEKVIYMSLNAVVDQCAVVPNVGVSFLFIHRIFQQISEQGCEGDFQGLVKECARFVSKIGDKADPSQPFCDIVKKVDK